MLINMRENKEILDTEYCIEFDLKCVDVIKESKEFRKAKVNGEYVKLFMDLANKRRNSMIVSYYKYGKAEINYKIKRCADTVKSLEMRIQKYCEQHNKDYILDIMNFVMLEYMFRQNDKFIKIEDINSCAKRIDRVLEINDNTLEKIKTMIMLYKMNGKADYLIGIAVACVIEFDNPTFEDSEYKPGEDEYYGLYGLGVNQMERLKNEDNGMM